MFCASGKLGVDLIVPFLPGVSSEVVEPNDNGYIRLKSD